MPQLTMFVSLLIAAILYCTPSIVKGAQQVAPNMENISQASLNNEIRSQVPGFHSITPKYPANDSDDVHWTGFADSSITGLNGIVRAFAMYQGYLVAGGNFRQLSSHGDSIRNIATWDGHEWWPLGTGMDDEVNALIIFDNELIAGGAFTTAGGIPASKVASWNGSTWKALGLGVNSSVEAFTIHDSKLIAGGYFTQAGGVPMHGISAWDGNSWLSVPTLPGEFFAWVTALAVEPAGRLVAGGSYVVGLSPQNRVMSWDGSSWTNLGSGLGPVSALTVHDNQILAAGSGYVKIWNGASWVSLGSGFNGSVSALCVLDGKLFAGGNFTLAGGTSANSIALWNGSSWSALSSGTDSTVIALGVYNGKLVAGGNFNIAGGRIADAVATWSGLEWQRSVALDNVVTAFTVFENKLAVGGRFSKAGNVLANYIAAWDGSSWSALGSGSSEFISSLATYNNVLIAGGMFNSGESSIAAWDGSSWTKLGVGTSGTVQAMIAYGGRLVVAGRINVVGYTGTHNIWQWDGSNWEPFDNGIGEYDDVYALTMWNGALVAGGHFSEEGESALENRVAVFDTVTSAWTPLPTGPDGDVTSLEVYDGRLIAGGSFSTVGGVEAYGIAVWDGYSWLPFGWWEQWTAEVLSLAVYDDLLFVGGSMPEGWDYALLNSWNGSWWSPVGSGIGHAPNATPSVRALCSYDNKLYVGGEFSYAGDKTTAFLAQWDKTILTYDTTVSTSYAPDSSHHRLPVCHNGFIGTRYTNESPIAEAKVDNIEFGLMKEPGQSFNSDNDVEIGIYTVDENLLPDQLLRSTTVSGAAIAVGWSAADTMRTVSVPMDNLHLRPAQEVVVGFRPVHNPKGDMNADTCVDFAVTTPDTTVQGTGPCILGEESSRLLIGLGGKPQVSYAQTTSVQHLTIASSYPHVETGIEYFMGNLTSAKLQYQDHLVQDIPISNEIEIYIGDLVPLDNLEVIGTYIDGVPDREFYPPFSEFTVNPSGARRTEYVNTSMYNLPEGNHRFELRFNGTMYDETCYKTETHPLYHAPWAAKFASGLDGEKYVYIATAPPIPLYQSDISFLGIDVENRLDLGLYLRQDSYLTGEQDFSNSANVEIGLMMFGVQMSWNAGQPSIIESDIGGIKTITIGVNEYTWTGDRIPIIWDMPIYEMGIEGVAEIRVTLDISVAPALYMPAGQLIYPSPTQDYGTLAVSPSINPSASLTGSAEVLFGLADASVTGTLNWHLCFPAQFHIVNGQPVSNADVCNAAEMCVRFEWSAGWGLYEDSWEPDCVVLFDQCDVSCFKKDDRDSRELRGRYLKKPAMARSDDKSRVMAAIIHRATPTTDDIFVAENTGLGWTVPVQATNTGMPKNYGDIGPYGVSGFAMTWVESNATLPPSNSPDSLASQTRTQEIYAAVKPSGSAWGQPVLITNDMRRDGMPKIVGSSSGLCLVWVRQPEGDAFDRTRMRIFYSTYDGASWRTPDAIPGQSGYNLQPNLTIDPATGDAIVVWIEDIDGDIRSIGDRTLKMATIQPNGTSSTASTIPSDLGVFNPSISIANNGNIAVGYESWGVNQIIDVHGISHSDTVGFGDAIRISASIKHGGSWSLLPLSIGDTLGYGLSPEATIDDSGYVYLAYRGFEKTEGGPHDGEIYITHMNLASGPFSWATPERLTDDTILTQMGDIAVDPGGKINLLYVKDTTSTDSFPKGFENVFGTTFIPQEPEYLCGDVDGDHDINIADAVYLVNYIFVGGAAPDPLAAGDADCSGDINIADVVYLITYIFKEGLAPCAGCK